MTYSISTFLYACPEPMDAGFIQKSNRITLVVDCILASLLFGSAVVLGLTLNGVLPITLSAGLATLADIAFWTSSGIAALTVLSNFIVYVIKKQTVTLESLREAILQAKTVTPSKEESSAAFKIPYHHIINGLFLGKGEALMEAARVSCNVYNDAGDLEKFEVSNPCTFATIITVCPLNACTMDFMDEKGHPLCRMPSKDFEEAFANKVKWLKVGELSLDQPEDWESIVHDCTFLQRDPTEPTLMDTEEAVLKACYAAKKEKIRGLDVNQWLEPTFREIDEAVLRGRPTLVHCQAGRSRSPTLLAAYLIKRCRVSPAQAINFLRSIRACVDSKFMKQLEEYATALGIPSDSIRE